MSERWRIEPEYVVRVDQDLGVLGVLLEPTTVVAKAWEQIIKIGQRTFWDPRTVLVVGAGPIGLLAAMIGVQHGLDVHVLDRVTDRSETGIGPGARRDYHSGAIDDIGFHPDIVVECTGVASLVQQAASAVVSGWHRLPHRSRFVDVTRVRPGGGLATEAVLKNLVVFGSVNANRRHYYRAAKALAAADRSWLEQLITRRVNPDDVDQIVGKGTDDIKVVMEFQQP